MFFFSIDHDVCPLGMVWSDCADCERTCENMHISCPSDLCLREGCVCPNGTVAGQDGKCIDPSECPCLFREQSYGEGAVIKRDCNHWWVLKNIWELIFFGMTLWHDLLSKLFKLFQLLCQFQVAMYWEPLFSNMSSFWRPSLCDLWWKMVHIPGMYIYSNQGLLSND